MSDLSRVHFAVMDGPTDGLSTTHLITMLYRLSLLDRNNDDNAL
jgi:hypothetical protein